MQVKAPQCVACERFKPGWVCEAFPEQIPFAIISGEHDHKNPFPGDNELRRKPIKELEAIRNKHKVI